VSTAAITTAAPHPVATVAPQGRLSRFVRAASEQGRLVVQPRMGFGDPVRMRDGLAAVRAVHGPTVGTITVDSYTRVNDHASARRALEHGDELNGYPVVAHGAAATRHMLEWIADDRFPVQVRHGSAVPTELFAALVELGADATEGGPVSYCLPYSRVPLEAAVAAWTQCCALVASQPDPMHLETFGGCMLGQLCPPSLLVALSVLEAMFFREQGLRSISVSYAQQTSPGQDLEALAALRRLAAEWIPDVDWHGVLYTYMGVYPRTPIGSFRILEESARLAVRGGMERLIVKTQAEAHRIPTIAENVSALEFALAVAEDERRNPRRMEPTDTGIYGEARLLIENTLGFGRDVGSALVRAFDFGVLDVPFCLHRDNANRSRAGIDAYGALYWADPGRMPVPSAAQEFGRLSARQLIDYLSFNERRFDREAVAGHFLKELR
jgi:methylaspartate mutase epsilon subunit